MAAAWKGNISFGLVNIPVTLSSAFKAKDLEFHLLHRKDGGRVGYQKICKKCGRTLEEEDIVKAFEPEKDSYVPLEKKDLETGKAENTRNLAISVFVKDDEIDTKLFEKTYYVLPEKNAENLYVLLREAIRGAGMTGVGKIQFGNREHLAALRTDGAAILLNLMHFTEEMVDPKSLKFPALGSAVGKKELELAHELVVNLKGHFQPEEFRNEHHATLEAIIRKRMAQGNGTVSGGGSRGPRGSENKIIDLMERLKQSLEKGAKAPPKKREEKEHEAAAAATAEKHRHRRKAG
jgi:DNA end-binding protein Ku